MDRDRPITYAMRSAGTDALLPFWNMAIDSYSPDEVAEMIYLAMDQARQKEQQSAGNDRGIAGEKYDSLA